MCSHQSLLIIHWILHIHAIKKGFVIHMMGWRFSRENFSPDEIECTSPPFKGYLMIFDQIKSWKMCGCDSTTLSGHRIQSACQMMIDVDQERKNL